MKSIVVNNHACLSEEDVLSVLSEIRLPYLPEKGSRLESKHFGIANNERVCLVSSYRMDNSDALIIELTSYN